MGPFARHPGVLNSDQLCPRVGPFVQVTARHVPHVAVNPCSDTRGSGVELGISTSSHYH